MLEKVSRDDGELGHTGNVSLRDLPVLAHSPSPESSSDGHSPCASLTAVVCLPSLDDLIAEIRYWHRQRCFAMEHRKRIDLALGSFLRLMLGWQKDKPEAERKRISKAASDLIKNPEGTEWEAVIAASIAARAPFAAIEARALKEMSSIASRLPVWESFGKSIRGFGPASLAAILAEAGNLSNYSNHSKLWKRMGVAVIDGVRQGGLAKGARAEDWIEHGYNPPRRSKLWNIGDALIKGNRDGRYRSIYLNRKAYEIARDPEMAPIWAHRRAQRYMEKRLLKDLWRAWRVGYPQGAAAAIQRMPHALNSEEAV